jgi:signal transduction histidine kinase
MPRNTPSSALADDVGLRFGSAPTVILILPVVLAFLVQVPGTIAVSGWLNIPPRFALISTILAGASALALLAARRWPGPTVVVVAALTLADLFVPPDLSPPFVALAFAIVGAVVRRARVWAIIAVGTAWILAIAAIGLLDARVHPFRIAITTAALAACFAIGEALRRRLDRGMLRRAQLQERRRTAEQDERTRIARELHDVLAHSLSQIAVQSGVGLHLFDREPERARDALASIRTLSATGLDEVRGVLSFLRGDEPALDTAPLTPQPQLADLAALAAQRTGLGLEVSVDDRLESARPPGAVQTTAYRIAQEALTNVVRHSGGANATITLARRTQGGRDDLVVAIEDDGTGLGPATDEGAGIRGMRERAELAGGDVTLSPAERGGTVVEARLPWEGAS